MTGRTPVPVVAESERLQEGEYLFEGVHHRRGVMSLAEFPPQVEAVKDLGTWFTVA